MASRRLLDEYEDDDSTDSEDNETNIVQILQRLIHNGRVQFLNEDYADDDYENEGYDDEFMPAASPPGQLQQMDTQTLKNNDIYLETSLRCGIESLNKRDEGRNVIQSLKNREISGGGFSLREKARIGNEFLPDEFERVTINGSKLFCGQFSKDGSHFLSASQDRNIRFYDYSRDDLKLIRTVEARDVGWSIVDTAYSPDGRQVVYSSWSESIHVVNLWDDTERQESLPLCPGDRRFCVFSLSYSADGSEILCGATEGNLYLYDLEVNQRRLKVHGHDEDVNCIAFADETSQIFFSGSDDGLCKVWDRRLLDESNSRPVGIFAGHKDGLTFIDSRLDCRYLITNSKDQTIKLWDMRVFSSEQAQVNTRKAVGRQQWDYRWQQLPRALNSSGLSRLDGDSSIMTYVGHKVQHTLIRARFSPRFATGQRYIYTGCASGRVVVYDLLTGDIEKVLRGHKACVRDVSWHPYKNDVISSSWDGTMCKWYHRRLLPVDDDEIDITSSFSSPERFTAFSDDPNVRRSARIAARRSTRSSNTITPNVTTRSTPSTEFRLSSNSSVSSTPVANSRDSQEENPDSSVRRSSRLRRQGRFS